ncbi:MAG: SDR family NAD(P)-dependent oxidoreductase [Streptosporangiaceae bacterium]
MRLSGAVALVTGGSSGIGAATAKVLAEAGVQLLITGRDRECLEAVAQNTGGLAFQADLSSADEVADLAGRALRAAARLPPGHATQPGAPAGIDILVNNAGVGWLGPTAEMTRAKVAELVAVNLVAPIELTRLLAPGMTARGQGQVVFVSSIVGAVGVQGEAVYAAAKAGLACFAESLAYELSPQLGVSVIVPGVVDTPFFKRRGQLYGRRRPVPIPAERVARAVMSALERDRRTVYVPQWMWVPARLHGAAPEVYRFLASRFGDPR